MDRISLPFTIFPEEYFYHDPIAGRKRKFSSILDSPQLDYSIIVPSYNEEHRLPSMLDEAIDHMEFKSNLDPSRCQYEIIVVDDGSTDGTTEVAMGYCRRYGTDKVRVLTLAENRGKGGAVRLGFWFARGRKLLFADADGATKFSAIDKLDEAIDTLLENSGDLSGEAIANGSRSHLEEEAIASRSIFRTVLMLGFHFIVWLFCVRSIRDTQCGFKMFTRGVARTLFYSIHVEKWAFDVELLYLAEKLGVPMTEVPVPWTEVDGSHIVPVFSWLQMGRDVGLIWLWYTLGIWRFENLKNALENMKAQN